MPLICFTAVDAPPLAAFTRIILSCLPGGRDGSGGVILLFLRSPSLLAGPHNVGRPCLDGSEGAVHVVQPYLKDRDEGLGFREEREEGVGWGEKGRWGGTAVPKGGEEGIG